MAARVVRILDASDRVGSYLLCPTGEVRCVPEECFLRNRRTPFPITARAWAHFVNEGVHGDLVPARIVRLQSTHGFQAIWKPHSHTVVVITDHLPSTRARGTQHPKFLQPIWGTHPTTFPST